MLPVYTLLYVLLLVVPLLPSNPDQRLPRVVAVYECFYEHASCGGLCARRAGGAACVGSHCLTEAVPRWVRALQDTARVLRVFPLHCRRFAALLFCTARCAARIAISTRERSSSHSFPASHHTLKNTHTHTHFFDDGISKLRLRRTAATSTEPGIRCAAATRRVRLWRASWSTARWPPPPSGLRSASSRWLCSTSGPSTACGWLSSAAIWCSSPGSGRRWRGDVF